MAKLIVDISDELKYAFKLKATENNQTMKGVIVKLIEEWLIECDLQKGQSSDEKRST
ncbi:MAG: hypothetical protein SWO11_02245 [Thermodesulfobacteriota bacterium]|nr:hypothetical protein [Thermodesulfobacteriota bacterium]